MNSNDDFFCPLFFPAAVFIFLTASARTGGIAADFWGTAGVSSFIFAVPQGSGGRRSAVGIEFIVVSAGNVFCFAVVIFA